MNKTKIVVTLLVLICMPVMMFADIREHADRFEFGASAGVGFYVGQKNPVEGSDLLRIQSYDAIAFGERSTLRWPGIETFGFSFGYRFDSQWNLKLQATRQRVCFAEYHAIDDNELRAVYYNAMWHLDVMAEYNLLNYGNVMMPNQRIYNVVPYVGFGLGITMFNENATLRALNGVSGKLVGNYHDPKLNMRYPAVGKSYEYQEHNKKPNGTNDVAVGLYVPVAFGVKWRLNDNVQLKGTFQYQLYFSNAGQGGLNSNLEGATYVDYYKTSNQAVLDNLQSRPTFDGMTKKVAGFNHDCLFSISAIFNFGKWYEDRLITY